MTGRAKWTNEHETTAILEWLAENSGSPLVRAAKCLAPGGSDPQRFAFAAVCDQIAESAGVSMYLRRGAACVTILAGLTWIE